MRRLIFCLVGALAVAGSVAFFANIQAYGLDQNNCLACHGNPEMAKTNADGKTVSLYVNEEEVNTAAHRYIDCTTCHTADPHNVVTPLNKLSLAEKCGTCHKYEFEQHLASIHGQQLASGNQDVATCVDCHSSTNNPHNVIRVLEYNAPTYKKNIAQTCAGCHDDEELMSDYGIVESVYESYMRSFHGKAIQLGTYEITQLDKATCTNCHGVHDIKNANDPDSPVSGLENLAATCEKCHEGAGIQFAASFLGHREASPDNIPVAHYTEILFNTLLISVLSFGAIVVIMAISRFSINRWRE
jgi:nitrate reductase cytochrome c-type subunit